MAKLKIPLLFAVFLYASGLYAQSIIRLEYFIDKDPGCGKATRVVFSGPKDTLLKTFTIPTNGLASGRHYVHVRVQDSSKRWSPWQLQLFFIEDTVSRGPITQAEFFIDKDPGCGKGTVLSISRADSVRKTFFASTSALSSGLHYLHVRTKIGNGFWSPAQFQMFQVQDTVNQGPITQVEYFVDKDPGCGKATSLAINKSDSVRKTFITSTNSLSAGFHFLHVRTRIGNGYWSPLQFQLFQIQDTVNQGPITQLEYFIDKEPGCGKATSLSISRSDSVRKTFQASVSSLATGRHYIHVRSKIGNGYWSPWQFQMFALEDTLTLGKLDAYEYFIDRDPGVGKGTRIAVSPALDLLEKRINYGTTTLAPGYHTFSSRVRVAKGLWSPLQSQMFYLSDPGTSVKINGISYVIDSSLLKKSRVVSVSINPPADTVKRIQMVKTDTSLRFGVHYLRIWAQQNNRLSSTWHLDTIQVINCPMLDTAAFTRNGRLCHADTLKFRQDITRFGTWPKDSFTFTWRVNSSVLSLTDTFVYRHKGADTFRLDFSFYRTSDPRCKGNLSQTIRLDKTPDDTLRVFICSGDSLRIHGRFRKSAGTYRFVGSTSKGCDSFSTYILGIRPVYRDTLNRQICAGDSLRIHGIFRKTAGSFVLSAKTKLGCDSIVRVVLKVNPVFRKSDTTSICAGDTLKRYGKLRTKAGTYLDSFKTRAGCDSLFTTLLRVNPVYRDTVQRLICSGDSLRIHGVFRKTHGTYVFKGKTIKACDSTSMVILKVLPVFRDTFRRSICNGDSLRIHGVFRKNAGVYVLNAKTYLGCDSIVRTELIVNPVYARRDTFRICAGDTLKVHGLKLTAAGTYSIRFKTIRNCDSLFTTTLIVFPSYNYSIVRGLCGGDSVFFSGSYRTKTGNYTSSNKTVKGCDSIVTLKLTVDTIIRSDDYPEICDGDSLKIGGVFRKTAGIYQDRFKAAKGCDSLVTRYLRINARDTTIYTYTLCFGEQYMFHGKSLSDTGVYRKILKNREGCDSLIVLNLKKRPQNRIILNGTVCFGEQVFVGNSFKQGSGVFRDTLKDLHGCDSLVVYTQTERPLDSSGISISICAGDSLFTGTSWKKIPGIYPERLTNRFNCDSFLTTTVKIRPVSSSSLNDTICFWDNYNFMGTIVQQGGVYQKVLQNAVGCDSTITLNLFQRPQYIPQVRAVSFAVLGTDRSYKLYQWFLNRNILAGETQSTIKVKQGGIYDVAVEDSLGCRANSWDEWMGIQYPGSHQVLLFPNPANEAINILSDREMNIRVFDAQGKQVYDGIAKVGKTIIPTIHLARGFYFIMGNNGADLFWEKVFISR